MSTLKVTTIQDTSGSNGSTSEQIAQGRAKAWVNFNGSSFGVRDSFNITSVVDDGTGQYTVNIDTDMADTNYCASVTSGSSDSASQTSQNSQLFAFSTRTAGSFKIKHGNTENNSNQDADDVNAIVFGDQ